jgi:hypothetical protein
MLVTIRQIVDSDTPQFPSESVAELPAIRYIGYILRKRIRCRTSLFLNYTFPNKFEPPYPPDFAANNPQKVPQLA